MKRELDLLVTQMHSVGIPYADAVREFKKRYLLEVLAHHKGNQCKAAEELGMHRNTLSRTLAELNLDTAQIRNGIRNGMRRPPMSERPRAQRLPQNVVNLR
ncbi:MAG: histidine kinase [Acidobacteriota bacterium]|nr:histidine kinase [Acidobacteriota bacterium]